jgi:hypothetical protein
MKYPILFCLPAGKVESRDGFARDYPLSQSVLALSAVAFGSLRGPAMSAVDQRPLLVSQIWLSGERSFATWVHPSGRPATMLKPPGLMSRATARREA